MSKQTDHDFLSLFNSRNFEQSSKTISTYTTKRAQKEEIKKDS